MIARWTVVQALSLVLIAGLASGCALASRSAPRIEAGTLDLRDWNFRDDGVVQLRGDWGFYWRRLVDPASFEQRWPDSFPVTYAPDRWRGVATNGERVTAHGYATYFLRVLVPEDAPGLSLKVRDAGTAYSLYANGEFVHGAGVVGTSASQARPGFQRAIVLLPPAIDGELQLVFHVSNYHYRTGGLWELLVLGQNVDVQVYADHVLAYSIFLASGIGVIGVYHLGLYSLRRKEASTLFFGLACLVAVGRLLSTDERYLAELLPGMSHDALVKVEFLTMGLGIPLFAAYMARLLPGCYPRWLLPVLIVPGLLMVVFVLLTPPLVFSELLVAFQAYVLFSASAAFYMVARAVRRGLEMAWAFALGFSVLAVTVVNDILKSNDFYDSPYYLLGLGLLVFIIIQSYGMSRRSAQAYDKVEALTSELEAYSATLEESVQQRTAELAEANARLEQMALVDELTQVANRRQFDKALEREWQLHRRREAPLSLLLLDIDFFKSFNDTYGHLRGDEALRSVAAALEGALARSTDLVARYGGEEFAILLPDTPANGCAAIAEKLRGAVFALDLPHQGSTYDRITVSIGGVTLVPGSEVGVFDYIEVADRCLYRAKSEGRNRAILDHFHHPAPSAVQT
jgi:diguanylate cyclase (GGDEF)-like protein